MEKILSVLDNRGMDYCAPGSQPGCSDAVVAGVVISKSPPRLGERKIIVDTGQAELRVFVTKDGPDVTEGTHVYVRVAWVDEAGDKSRWITSIENSRTRLTLCVNSDVEGNEDVTGILTAPSTVPVGTVSVLSDLREPVMSSLREMLVVSPALDTSALRRTGA